MRFKMARNRKNEAAGVRFGPAIKAVMLCLFIAGSGIGYVWQKSQIGSLGKEIKERETKLAELKRQNKLRNDQLGWMRSPPVMENWSAVRGGAASGTAPGWPGRGWMKWRSIRVWAGLAISR